MYSLMANISPHSYLFLCDGKGLGGLELQMLERTLDARERGAAAVLACSSKGKLSPYAASRGLKPERVEVNIPYYDPIATFRLGKIARKHRATVCVVGQSRLLSQALIARKVWGLEMAVVFYQQMQSGHPKRDWFHDKIYSSVDAAVVLTQQMKHELEQTTVMQPDKVHVIPYGINAERFILTGSNRNALKRQFDIPEDTYVVGCVSRLDFQKDQLTLIRAFAKSELPANSVLVIAGDVTPGYEGYDEELRKATAELGIAERTIFLPFTNEIPKLLSCFDVFVLPSRSETFGLVVVEAMAAGVPVVATEAGGVPEIITDGKTGLLFPAQNDQPLADHLSRLAASEELRQQIGGEAQLDVRKRYDYRLQTDRFFEVCANAFISRKNG